MASRAFTLRPFAGIRGDLAGRSACYMSDWADGFKAHVHILAPSTYILFASAIPALTFGEQLADETDGQINGVHVLLTTSLCGILQAVLGGQPLLIVGVAEPIVLIYAYMFTIARDYGIPFLPWASVTLFWVSLFCALLAIFNTCTYIHHFTRFSRELFGLLITILFLQQAVKGLYSEFEPPHGLESGDARRLAQGVDAEATTQPWLLFNGAFALFLACALLGTSLLSVHARDWMLFRGPVRRFIADYGTAISVLIWTLVSLIPKETPEGVPRRLVIPSAFAGSPNYGVLSRLHELEGWHIGAAIIPAAIIAVLFFFDHNVSSQLAQEGLHLKKPTAYHWDFFMLAIMTAVCGLLGLPPVNGVIPQAPMHSRANTVWLKKKWEEDPDKERPEDAAPCNVHDDIHEGRDYYIRENRVSNLIQAMLCGVCLLITNVLQQIPRSDGAVLMFDHALCGADVRRCLTVALCAVLWGFFAFMALEGLPGSQFYKRCMLYFTDRSKIHILLENPKHDSYLDKVDMRVIYKFTFLQILGLLICYGITWAGIGGISFPIYIMILVPLREYVLPKMFVDADLQELDPLNLNTPVTSPMSVDLEGVVPDVENGTQVRYPSPHDQEDQNGSSAGANSGGVHKRNVSQPDSSDKFSKSIALSKSGGTRPADSQPGDAAKVRNTLNAQMSPQPLEPVSNMQPSYEILNLPTPEIAPADIRSLSSSRAKQQTQVLNIS